MEISFFLYLIVNVFLLSKYMKNKVEKVKRLFILNMTTMVSHTILDLLYRITGFHYILAMIVGYLFMSLYVGRLIYIWEKEEKEKKSTFHGVYKHHNEIKQFYS